ncbi:MAG: ATP-dependent metallopeptidase FtsH/Yme1/Tma family protein, partial [Synechococcales cyanobacterium]
MNKRWRYAGLYVLLAIVVVVLATVLFERPTPNIQTWRYSRFIAEVEKNQVERVRIRPDRSMAEVATSDGTKVEVNLPNDPDLLKILMDHKVDISVRPPEDDSLWRLLSSLFVPVLILVGLFFLLRRAQNGPGSQAMNFGKSRAR